ncbi:MAG: hypothetical protein K0S73_2281 [Stenotrophomonas rhizophila]|jgi:hypothetical protein|uniref:Uncharacterized protein n=1 Tax=Stenotrophomonas rhizophila TaxID=216778 RepID=A0AAP5AGS5_9GAMM|nr:hypothetical protein [Stenotrophomonas rhizophila]MDF2818341.1 hypothetical protein [Stenotrophomonas rhizophila]MDQ1107543.1 hypothetical protein [Stenotrophomonas rhizophila]
MQAAHLSTQPPLYSSSTLASSRVESTSAALAPSAAAPIAVNNSAVIEARTTVMDARAALDRTNQWERDVLEAVPPGESRDEMLHVATVAKERAMNGLIAAENNLRVLENVAERRRELVMTFVNSL